MACAGCDKDFREEELAPYQKNGDGTYAHACRSCINEWIKLDILWGSIPFWMRRMGFDKV